MRLLLAFILCFISWYIHAQVGRVDRNERIYDLVDRYEVKYGNFEGFMGLSPKFRSDLYEYFAPLDSVGLSPKEEYDREVLLDNLTEFTTSEIQDSKAWYRYFYENPAYLFSMKKGDFWVSLNPILYLKGGMEKDNSIVLQNTRGVRIKGSLGKSLYFSSAIYENQASFQEYHLNTIKRFRTIPGNAFYKNFDFNIENTAYDYLNADGFVGLRINKFTALELGHGKQFVGHGIRSLLLSDYATNYLYLRANTSFWKIHYQNLFTELAPFTEKLIGNSRMLPKKYLASHMISFKPNHRWELGIFETVVFSREDYFEFQYLNPIIFYRTVEQFLNSSDNVLIGVQGKWNFIDGYQLYGQFILDDFKISEIREDFNWWGNKFGIQTGLKVIDFLKVDQLDMQLEYNMARPYLYSHRSTFDNVDISSANYSHFSQPLAHPLGANFSEFLWNINYRITNKWFINSRFLSSIQGVGTNNINFGSNILLDNITREGNNNQKFLQGERVNINLFALTTGYELYRNMFLDFDVQYRNAESKLIDYNDKSFYFGLGIRVNYNEEKRDY